jgi:hypothetical protein
MYQLQRLLWDIRRDADIARRFRHEPQAVLETYRISGPDGTALRSGDFKALYDRGCNPYLLYFCALQIGVDRAAY